MVTGQDGFLRDEAIINNFPVFTVPEKVGGRFSVLTMVGIVPALFLGINISKILKGWMDMAKQFMSDDPKHNLPFQLAITQHAAEKNTHVFMPYASRLRRFGDWFTQLLAESTGKDGKGYTPIAALGATDQHSLVQLLAEGPRDFFVLFLEIEKFSGGTLPLQNIPNHPQTQFLQNTSFHDLCSAELQATRQALNEKNCPSCTITLPELSPYTLGQLFMLFMGSTAFLGEMLKIDAYNQPGVERGKILTKEILLNKQK